VIPHILYLDVDGVVLVPDFSRHGYRVADYAEQFLSWAVEHFDARWLSTRCQNGEAEEVRRAFRLAGLSANSLTWTAINRIPSATWGTSKAQAIDLQSDFYWIDDNPDQPSVDLLRQHGREDRLIRIIGGDSEALLQARKILERVWR
jgi:hypothetical protein